MKRLLKASKAFTLIAAILLTGCYEGFHKPSGSGNGPGGGDNKGGGAGDKTYGIAVLDVIRPSTEAMASPVCGNIPASLMDLRQAEINARVKNLTTLIEGQADLVRVVVTEVTLTDCQTFSFSTIETRSQTASPDPDVNDNMKAKIALNVRLIVWYGAGGSTQPSSSVTSTEWADSQRLRDMGFTRRLSVNQFAITGPSFGYLWNWQSASDQSLNFISTVTPNPVPSNQGVQEVMTAVAKSAVEFSDWLGQKVHGI